MIDGRQVCFAKLMMRALSVGMQASGDNALFYLSLFVFLSLRHQICIQSVDSMLNRSLVNVKGNFSQI